MVPLFALLEGPFMLASLTAVPLIAACQLPLHRAVTLTLPVATTVHHCGLQIVPGTARHDQ